MRKDLARFLYENPVFTLREIRDKLPYEGSDVALWSLIDYYVKRGQLLKIKKTIYGNVLPGHDPKKIIVDPYLIANKLTPDAVIGYQSALGYWGNLHSLRNDFTYITKKRLNKSIFSFQGVEYRAVSFPKALTTKGQELFGTKVVDRLGAKILMTTLERTFVDILDRPYLLGNDWEEIYRSLGSISYLDLDEVKEYTLLLEKPILTGKVGFFLDLFKEAWMVEEKHLSPFRRHVPKGALYIDRSSKEANRLIPDWNIIVPESLITQSWEEPYEDI